MEAVVGLSNHPLGETPVFKTVIHVSITAFGSPNRMNKKWAKVWYQLHKFKQGEMFMNAVGIDVSKGKSMVAVLQPLGVVAASPFEVDHTEK